MFNTTENKTSFQKICHSVNTIIDVLINSILFWTIVLIGGIVLDFLFMPFFTSGCVFIAFALLIIYCIIGYNLYETELWGVCIGVFITAALMTLLYISCANDNNSSNPIIKSTEYYEPVNVIKNESQIVLVGNFHTVISNTLRLYTSKHPYICKDEQYNGFNVRVSDRWYICTK